MPMSVGRHPETECSTLPLAGAAKKALLPEHAPLTKSLPKGATSLCMPEHWAASDLRAGSLSARHRPSPTRSDLTVRWFWLSMS
jgi:hypothetical protein